MIQQVENHYVYKYHIPMLDPSAMIPQHATILKIGVQDRELYAWCKVNPTMKPVKYTFHIEGTGYPLPAGRILNYLDTVFIDNLVLHVFLDATD